jgi:DNA-directed RNA polymerase beta' subunit
MDNDNGRYGYGWQESDEVWLWRRKLEVRRARLAKLLELRAPAIIIEKERELIRYAVAGLARLGIGVD